MTDFYGYKSIIGIVVPSTNTSAQPEFESMRVPGITTHVSRMNIGNAGIATKTAYDEFKRGIKHSITMALDTLIPCKPDGIIIAMSPESLWEDRKQHFELKKELENHAGESIISMAPEAYLNALRSLKINGKKPCLGLITPYESYGNAKSASFFEEHGYKVKKIHGFGCHDLVKIAHISSQDMDEAITALNTQDIDVIVQVGSNIPMSKYAACKEREIGKPILANNVVSYYEMIKKLGIKNEINSAFDNKFIYL